MVKDFSENEFRKLCEVIKTRTIMFSDDGPGIIMRHDVDDDLYRSSRMAEIEAEYGIRSTYFILDTSTYWQEGKWAFDHIKTIQSLGHEIGWHNNALIQWHKRFRNSFRASESFRENMLMSIVASPLDIMRSHGLKITGSASHGDRECAHLGVINYEIFHECERTQEAKDFPKPIFFIPKISMRSFGLEYEAYHVPYDLYLSESGGKKWNKGFTEKQLLETPRIQILIHPQWWSL